MKLIKIETKLVSDENYVNFSEMEYSLLWTLNQLCGSDNVI